MRFDSGEVEPTFFSRYECKYLLNPALVAAVRSYLAPFVRPDPFALPGRLPLYAVCSLYLDSPDLQLYRQTLTGEEQRFKLRVRTYDDRPESPAYLEVKRRHDAVVHKRRAALDRTIAAELLSGRYPAREILEAFGCARDVDYFRLHVERTAARPVMRIKYVREAYQSTGNEPVRITLDTELCHAPTFIPELRQEVGHWTPTAIAGTILEIKFTEQFPWWVRDLVQAFDLERRSIPKYILSVDHMLDRESRHALSLGGLTLPPRGA